MAPASVAYAEPTLTEIEAQLGKAGDELEDVVEAYNKINEDLAATQAQTADLATRLQPLQDNLTKVSANVDEIAVAAFKNNAGLRNLSVVLNAGSSNSL